MIFVDTSIWIEFFRGKDPSICAHLSELLDQEQVALSAPVYTEILSGSRVQEMDRLKRVLSALPLFYPEHSTWNMVESWFLQGLLKKERFGFVDLLIAAIAFEQDAYIWSLDQDFGRLAKLKLVKEYTRTTIF